MRVDELRAALEKYDTATLKKILVELYKKIPKKIKEENGFDDLLLNFEDGKKAIKQEKQIDFDALAGEIEEFIDYADKQYYFGPNQYVRKNERSKWRFTVMHFIKDLLTVKGEDSEEAGDLLADIYAMLCYGCSYYIFSTENPFSAVGYKQVELLKIVLEKLFYSGFSQTAIKKAVFLTLDSEVDHETLNRDLSTILVNALKTPETKEEALLQCIAYQKEYYDYQSEKEYFKYKRDSSSRDFRQNEHKKYAIELYSMLKFSLYEYDEGIEYFWKHYNGSTEDILYYLLKLLNNCDLNELWIREYEKAVANGINPHDSLKKEYDERKKDNKTNP
ncbi:MAG: hypothetical protein FWC47_03795 [Oscillospiraceae bacterium]|nr:hypothetical protein [Oscillospiraceae bacterium]